ncbi:MAG: hypothetical protein GY856_18115, partial [bacterium]|nr:hypothetical protein [bacterium]
MGTITWNLGARRPDPGGRSDSRVVAEASETFLLSLASAEHAVLPAGPAVGTILDDDPPPEVSIADVTVTEGDSGNVSAVFTLSLSGASGREITVDYQSAEGTAASTLDYLTASGNVVFAPGTTSQTVAITVLGDVLDEPDETFRVVLSNPVNVVVADGEALGTIVDDDDPPKVSIDDVSVVEGDAGTNAAVFTLTLAGTSGFDVAVDYLAVDGTAQAGSDYLVADGTVTFPAGSLSATVTVELLGDVVDEYDETFRVELTNPQHALLGDGVGEGTIVDDDEALVRIDDVEIDEGDAGTTEAIFTVELTRPSEREVSVEYVTVAETAAAGDDYVTAGGTLVFTAGTTAQAVAVE